MPPPRDPPLPRATVSPTPLGDPGSRTVGCPEPDSGPGHCSRCFPPRTHISGCETCPGLGSQLNLVPPIVSLGPWALLNNFPRFSSGQAGKSRQGHQAHPVFVFVREPGREYRGISWGRAGRAGWAAGPGRPRGDPPRPKEGRPGRGPAAHCPSCPLLPALLPLLPVPGPEHRAGGGKED